jgi:PadR family transcriptional regulator AphA
MEKWNLTTTSYALLGWLDVKPWTTYELARQMRANLSYFWPRAESRLYEEPKNLVAHGLARQERSMVGRRQRTVYSITDEGRSALRAWQATPSARPVLEFETLVHLYFGATATPQQMAASLQAAADMARDMFEQGAAVGRAYLDGSYPFPERAQFSRFIYDFLWSFAELLRDWSERSRAELALWQDTEFDEAKRGRALELIRECLDRWQPETGLAGASDRAPATAG